MQDNKPRRLVRPVQGSDGRYKVTSTGVIIGTYGAALKLHPTGHLGRLKFFYKPSPTEGMRNEYVDHAVLQAFVGPCPDNHFVVHLDGDLSNNRLENLRWTTDARCSECSEIVSSARPGIVVCGSCKARRKQVRRKTKGDARRSRLAQYGLTVKAYEAMVKARRGRCDICGTVPQRTLFVDHSHVTGDVRGLLCGPCNSGLGMLGDSLEGINRARAYLQRVKTRNTNRVARLVAGSKVASPSGT